MASARDANGAAAALTESRKRPFDAATAAAAPCMITSPLTAAMPEPTAARPSARGGAGDDSASEPPSNRPKYCDVRAGDAYSSASSAASSASASSSPLPSTAMDQCFVSQPAVQRSIASTSSDGSTTEHSANSRSSRSPSATSFSSMDEQPGSGHGSARGSRAVASSTPEAVTPDGGASVGSNQSSTPPGPSGSGSGAMASLVLGSHGGAPLHPHYPSARAGRTPPSLTRSFGDPMSDDELSAISPDVEQHGPFYLPTSASFASPHCPPLMQLPQRNNSSTVINPRPQFPNAQPTSSAAASSSAPSMASASARSSLSVALPPARVASQHLESELLPCEVSECYYWIPAAEYDNHMLLHHADLVRRARVKETEAQREHERIKAIYGGGTKLDSPSGHAFSAHPSEESSVSLVPCDYSHCNQLVPIEQYAAHQRAHENAPGAAAYAAQHGHRKYQALAASPEVDQYAFASASSAPRNNPSSSAAAGSVPSAAFSQTPSLHVAVGARDSDPNFVTGIVQLLTKVFATKRHLEVYLCNPIQFFYRSRGDGGFGCGYKNIQTLCSALLQFDLYRETLFDGMLKKPLSERNGGAAAGNGALSSAAASSPFSSTATAAAAALASSSAAPASSSSSSASPLPRMPTIAMLQSFIDTAHQRGFDVVGAAQVGQLRHSKTWIGAVEAHALFCSYKIRSELVDFKSSHVGLMEYVWNYFQTRTKPVALQTEEKGRGANGSRAAASGERKNGDVSTTESSGDSNFDTHARHYSPRSGASSPAFPPLKPTPLGPHPSSFCPPLYFQHQGHSRSIIGIVHNHRTKCFRLLVVDPDMHGGGAKLINGLSSTSTAAVTSALKLLYRTEESLRASEYQMVMISSYGLMSDAEQQKSKRPFSTVISALDGQHGRPSTNAGAQQTAQQSGECGITTHERGAGGASAQMAGGKRWKMERREVAGGLSLARSKNDASSVEPDADAALEAVQEDLDEEAAVASKSNRPQVSARNLVSSAKPPVAPPRYRQLSGIPVIPPSRLPLPESVLTGRSNTGSPHGTTGAHADDSVTASAGFRQLQGAAAASAGRSSSQQAPPRLPRAASCSRIPSSSRLLQMSHKKTNAEAATDPKPR